MEEEGKAWGGWEDEGRDAIGRGGEKKDNVMISGKKNWSLPFFFTFCIETLKESLHFF